MWYNDKKVYEISQWGWNRATRTGDYEQALWCSRGRENLFLGDVKFDEEKRVTTLPEDSVLYFDKSSEFPRMKLQNTKFKRCIKLDKADYIVIGKSNNTLTKTNAILYEDGNRYIFVRNSDIYAIAGNTQIDFVIRARFPNAIRIYSGIITDYYTEDKYKIAYTDGTYTKPFIYDSDLNKAVDKSFDTISDEDLQAVIGLLSSPDVATVNLGLQMLAGFNVSSCPGLINFILHSYPRWKGCYKSTTITDNLLRELNVSRYNVNPGTMLAEILNNSTKEEQGRLIPFIEPVMKEYIEKLIDNYLYRIKDDKCPKVTINVEWPDSD